MVKITQFAGLLLLIVSCVAFGFFFHHYIQVEKENIELKAIVRQALELSDTEGATIRACMATLTSCSRLIENPQMFRQLQQDEIFGIQHTHEVASGATKQGSKEGMGPGGKGGVEASWRDARKGGRD